MNEYEVNVYLTLDDTLTVNADSPHDARDKAIAEFLKHYAINQYSGIECEVTET